jgi:HlyD family secretion protein
MVLAGLAVGGFKLWQKRQALNPTTPAQSRAATATVETRNIRFAVTAAGDIGPADQVSVRMEVNGRISDLPVDIGDVVKKGARLCRLDDRDLQIEKDQRVTEISGAELQIESAVLRLIKAQRDYDRGKRLLEEKLIPQETFDNFKTEWDAALNQKLIAQNNLEKAKKALNLIEDRITKTQMAAPFDCTVLTRPVSLGQTVSGAAGFNSGTEIMTIANLNDMVVNAHVNQADVIRLNPGQVVEIQVESLPDMKIEGRLERIAPQATIRNNIKGFATRIQIKGLDARVRPGMTATLTIPVASAENVLAVPLSAVFTEDGERFVYVQSAAGPERRDVTVGITDYQFAEIQSGLQAGDVVMLEMPKAAPDPSGNGGAGPGRKAAKAAGTNHNGKTMGGGPGREASPKRSGT